jgi:nitrogen-specific signal transduction histidine kinase
MGPVPFPLSTESPLPGSRRPSTPKSPSAPGKPEPVDPRLRPEERKAPAARPADFPAIGDPFFRDLVLSMRNGVLAITRDGAVAGMNPEAHRIFQVERSQPVVGRPCADVLQDHPDVIRVLASAFDLTHLPNRAEIRLKTSGRVIGYTLSHIYDERGRSTGVAMFFKDLTKVEQLEERERLRDRLAALGEMAAAIAHEVKNPLAGIEVMAGVLKRQVPDSADAQSILNDIINEAKMANRIVHEALEFVRPIRLQVEHTSIADVIADSISLAENKVRRGDIRLHLHVEDGLPPIQGDHHQLCQLFTNLLINAFEALEGTGSVAISAREGVLEEEPHAAGGEHVSTRTVVVDVVDDGPGVPKELSDRIFNAFFTTKPQGSGLGLAIVRKVVDAHDGRIDILSVDKGTHFRVTLPVSGADDWFAAKAPATPEATEK